MRIVLSATLIAATVMFAAGSQAATTAPGAPYPRVAAGDCGALAAKLGSSKVWRTWFSGAQRDLFDQWTDYSAAPCFATLASCTAWLYWAQTDWPDNKNVVRCRRGI